MVSCPHCKDGILRPSHLGGYECSICVYGCSKRYFHLLQKKEVKLANILGTMASSGGLCSSASVSPPLEAVNKPRKIWKSTGIGKEPPMKESNDFWMTWAPKK